MAVFFIFCDVRFRILAVIFMRLRYVPSVLLLVRAFIVRECDTFCQGFYGYFDMFACLLSLTLQIWALN